MMITAPDPGPASHRSRYSLVQAIQTSTYFLPALALSACASFISTGAQVQVKPEIASCAELKDEAIVAQAEMCSAHIGCVYVLNVQKTCARAKGYLERLQTAIGEGTRTVLGSYRKEVTPDAIFTAELGSDERANLRMLDAIPTSQRRSQEIAAKVRDVGTGDILRGAAQSGASWVYYGQIQDGKEDGIGTLIFSSGELQRGQFRRGSLRGASDVLYSGGARYIGDYGNIEAGQRSGQGAYIYKNGTKQEGTFAAGEIVSGTTYRPDGKVSEKGNYDKAGKLSFGQRFDTEGVITAVNVPAERQAAREAAVRNAGETARVAAEAENRRKREEAVRAEQQFQTSLQTLNPGQLFARADELSAQGDSARAREVQRALMSRFPNHPLAATAARQMAGESSDRSAGGVGSSAAGAASGTSGSASPKPSSFSKESSRYSSICMRNAAKAEEAISAAKARRYFGGAVDLEIFDMAKRIAQPCMAYDAKAKWAYDDAEQARGISQCRSTSCSRWPQGETGEKTRQWFEIFSGEFNKMMANWEGYSRDLDPPGSSSPREASGVNRAVAGRLSAQQCESMKRSVMTTKVPPNTSVTASTETVMFMTKTVLDMIAGGCPTDGTTPAQIEAERQERQRQYTAAESACNAVQSGGRRCVARVHTAAEVSRPAVSSAAQNTQQPGGVPSYDPVTGRCLGEGCCSLPGITNSECPGPRRSSGGGIRTAR
ncbi:hypothetical protein [Variovorax sp. Root473]|uniref:hypothetical protein n=1 Tax=Variovorax sp. Root473 TaxID=1736541 RepID=UPI0006F8D37B|nr:hypothetical protein [Variovorax sp. Root473]KQX93887.1 hypothetical protein ASD34_24335 [Variovorax sp. Root473]